MPSRIFDGGKCQENLSGQCCERKAKHRIGESRSPVADRNHMDSTMRFCKPPSLLEYAGGIFFPGTGEIRVSVGSLNIGSSGAF